LADDLIRYKAYVLKNTNLSVQIVIFQLTDHSNDNGISSPTSKLAYAQHRNL